MKKREEKNDKKNVVFHCKNSAVQKRDPKVANEKPGSSIIQYPLETNPIMKMPGNVILKYRRDD